MGHVLSRGRLGLLSCVVLAVISMAACAGSDPLSSSADGPLGSASGSSTQLDCEGRRFIAIKNNPLIACDTLIPSLDWSGESLFRYPAVSNDLLKYCVFRWIDPVTAPPSAEVAALQGNPNLQDVSEDCPVIVPQNATLQASLAREQRGWIHAAAQGLSPLPPALASSSAPVRPSRLAVVDNAPDSIGPNPGLASANALPPILPRTTLPFGEHGEVLAHLGRDLGCPDGNTQSSLCAVHVETVLALQSGNSTSQPGDPGYPGGLFGTRGDLVRAIQRAVDDWTSDLLGAGGAEPRLVINLSLGWEDRSPETRTCRASQPGDLDSPSRAVYDAIVYARCHGALVIAASGNHTGGSALKPQAGLVCPASFMQWDAPNDAYCDVRVFAEDPTFSKVYEKITSLPLRPPVHQEAYDPLVHPVGGVDFGDRVLVPHRPASLPPLVAPGFLGASYENDFTTVEANSILPQQPPDALSGTSVPTAIVSAIAATAWAYAPELAPADLMSLIHASGVSLSNLYAVEATRPPNVLPGSPVVRRASLCRTLAGLGLLPLATCSEASAFRDQPPSQNPPLSPSTSSLLTAHYASTTVEAAQVSPISIDATPLGTLFTYPAALDVSPQPVWPSCPPCGWKPSNWGEIFLYIDPTMPLDNPFLVIDGVAYGSASGAPLHQTISTKTVMKLTGLSPTIGPQSRAVLVGQSAGSSVYAQIPLIY
ncbi:MAG: hypothetical protein QM820_33885 [Minicystis sp.]